MVAGLDGRGAADTPARRAARALLVRAARRPTAGAPPVAGPDASRRFRARIAYDGSGLAGWQRQHDRVSVQELIEVAIEEATTLPAAVAAAGRTDAGVHAEGQVVAFDSRTLLPPRAVAHLCDHVLPPAVRVLDVADAPADFDPQRHCVGKLYRYLIRISPTQAPAWDRVAWRIPAPLDLRAMRDAAAFLVGTHDFRAFRNDPGPDRRDEPTVRTVTRIDVRGDDDLVRVEAEGPGFLYMMVRNLAAALVEVGSGRRPPGWCRDTLASRDRARNPPPAPAGGLTLVRVDYDPPWPDAPAACGDGRRAGGNPPHPE